MITVVSGLPRSGTSMMMQMLEAAGMEILSDGLRPADESNLMGYYEYEPVKKLIQDKSWLSEARGKAIKIVSLFLPHLPLDLSYRIIFMNRDMDSILASQASMLGRQGLQSPANQDTLRQTFETQLVRTKSWMEQQSNMDVRHFDYDDCLSDPVTAAVQLCEFIEMGDVLKTAAVVRPDLKSTQ